MKFNTFSRFRNTNEVLYNDVETIDVWTPPEFLSVELDPQLVNIYAVTPQYEGRPDLISQAIYGSTMYDWVLITFNNITDTLNWPKSGETIKYPTQSIVITGVSA